MPTWCVVYRKWTEYRIEAETETQAKADVELHWQYSASPGPNVRIVGEGVTVHASLIAEKKADEPCPLAP